MLDYDLANNAFLLSMYDSTFWPLVAAGLGPGRDRYLIDRVSPPNGLHCAPADPFDVNAAAEIHRPSLVRGLSMVR